MASQLTSKEIAALKRWAARAQNRADVNQIDKRQLQIEVRTLKRSRDQWKDKFLKLDHANKMAAFFSPPRQSS